MDEKGPITFAEYMEVVLYWPDGGYYTSAGNRWGRGGDYVTSLDMSPLFPKVLAVEILEFWDLLGRPGEFTLVEAGAGRGWLTKGILEALSVHPGVYGAIRAVLIEKNPFLKGEPGGKITWLDDITLLERPFTGCIISNELLDSFPVHIVIRRPGGLKEVYVGRDGDSLRETEGEPSTDKLSRYLEDLGIELPEGRKFEVNLDAPGWIQSAGSLLDKGFVLTIDYGYPARELYSPERNGTLLCHYRHTANDNPYVNIGAQDITAHVDFTTLVKAGAWAGLELTGFTTQKNFLLGLGILEEALDAGSSSEFDRVVRNEGIKRLIMPGGPGDVFKVLVQHKGIAKPCLKGFSFKDMSRSLRDL